MFEPFFQPYFPDQIAANVYDTVLANPRALDFITNLDLFEKVMI